MKKTLVIKLKDDKEITITYTKNSNNEWVSTMSDECMCDIWMFYPEVVRECE